MFLTILTGVMLGGFISVSLISIFIYFWGRRKRETQYHLKVNFAHGTKTKLILNQTQYDQFRAWLERPEGLWDIGDDNAFVSLNRQNVASVEVRKR